MNAYEDTKLGRSVVTETLRSLVDNARLCRERIDCLEAGQHFNRSEVVAGLGKLLDACQNLRDAILSEDSAATWSTKEELHELVNRLDDAAVKRRQYLDLAQFLANGTIVHRRERTRQERLVLRDAAVAELMEISELNSPPELPGPAVEKWLQWACGLEDGANEPDLFSLKSNFPRLDEFVSELEIDWWRDGIAASPVLPNKSNPAVDHVPEAPEAAKVSEVLAEEEPSVASSASSIQDEDLEEAIVPEIQPKFALPIEESISLHAEKSETTLIDETAPDSISSLTDTILSGKLSFFAWSDVDHFTRHIEISKTQEKKERKIRALIATSHWLLPNDQNPVQHHSCGIRALTGYAGTSDLVAVSPDEAMSAVEMDHHLDLFVGGADLLRWALLQPSENQFNGIASIRRLRFDQLKAWFGEIYKIELADQQFRDIYTLTSGIPILVGELHRIIIANPAEPPTWIGHAPWLEIKQHFEKQLPIVAQDLRKGDPSVRLTEREIAILKMMVIASDDSSTETLATNLTADWQQYGRKELRQLSSRDEASVALLQDLGLLPMQRTIGLERIKALLPVEPSDAIRQVVEFL